MDVTSSLLVAMMFVMVLSIGIGNILMGLSALLNQRSPREIDWLPTSWVLLLLLQHLHMFWHTITILKAEEWGFGGFLYVVTGPILLFLVLANSKALRLHVTLTGATWALSVSLLISRALNVV